MTTPTYTVYSKDSADAVRQGSHRAALPNLYAALRTYNDATPATLRLIGLGSSVGLGPNGALDNANSTTAYLSSKLLPALNRYSNQTWTTTNGSVAGSTISSALTAGTDYASAKTSASGPPTLTLLTYGMNDGTPAQYFAGQTLPGVYTAGQQLIGQIQADGGDAIILTTPHLNTDTYNFGAYTGPYSYPGASPVPTAANSIVTITNAAGAAVKANYLQLRVNDSLRQLAADMGVVCIDVERWWLNAVAQYGNTALFDSGQTVHPNLFGFQKSFFPAIDAFVASLRQTPVQYGLLPASRAGVRETVSGASSISVGNGGSFTIPLTAGTAGVVTLTGSSGGGWHSVWTGSFTALSTKTVVAQSSTAFAEAGNVFGTVAGSSTGPGITVTATATGSGSSFAWHAKAISGS